MNSTHTLAIDFGSKNIGISLVRNQDGVNIPLFAGTALYNRFFLSKKVEPRVQMRRMRRTKKTKAARLSRLKTGLISLGLDAEVVTWLVNYCRRRGYKSLFDEELEPKGEKKDEEEVVFRFSREEFFSALENELLERLPEDKLIPVLDLCEDVLNRDGDRFKEVRLIRIDNRGASRCAWDGCNSVTPRRDNALRDALAQFVFTVYVQEVRGDPDLYEKIQHLLDQLTQLGQRLRHVGGSDPKKERQVLLKRIGEELKLLKVLSGLAQDLPEEAIEPKEAWAHIRRNLMNLIKQSGGRNRFCRHHSAMYVSHLVDGKPIPFKRSLTESDMTSRREEILFQKLWRYIEARILPLAPAGIDRVVVERTAFDMLAGTRKQRQEVAEDYLEEMYQQGPRYGFKNDLDMLRAEFGGLCAYCGGASSTIVEREHILPQADFFFDSYLNKVPACPDCNRQKGAAAPGAAGLTINQGAYQAYEQYLKKNFTDKQKPPHILHNIKKGILNLLTHKDRVIEAERLLAMIADNLGRVVESQRGPRPLARYLCEKLRQRYDRVPQVAFRSGRHTAIWRQAAYPDFDKAKEKVSGGTINHALDAMILACDLPPVTALEARNLPPWVISNWGEKVRSAAPQAGRDGIPTMSPPDFAVPGFEQVLPGNFIETDLARLNWNHKHSRVQRQGIYGWCGLEDTPAMRVAAAGLAASLREADKKKTPEDRQQEVKKEVVVVVHPRLRAVLEAANTGERPGERTAAALISWLRQAVKGSLKDARLSSHPADQARAKVLGEFADGPGEAIPAVIGVRIRYPRHKAQMDLHRVDHRTGRIVHRYEADPANQALIAAYQGSMGQVRRDKPLTLKWRQSGAIIPGAKALGAVPAGPLQGRALGQPRLDQGEWTAALHAYLRGAGVVEYATVSQGCVVCYEDGSERYIQNFSSSPKYGFKKSLLKGIVGVRRSPLSGGVNPNIKI